MEGLIIPQISVIGVCIVVVCVVVSVFKPIIPKRLIVLLPIVISLPLGFMVALAECGWHLMIIQTMLIRTFSICAGSMASYDIVSKTIKSWKNNIEDDNKDEADNG